MTIESEFVFWTVLVVTFVAAVVVALVGTVFASAGYVVLRDRGHGTIRSATAITAALLVPPTAVVWIALTRLPPGPSPTNDPMPAFLAAAAFLCVLPAGVLSWAVARGTPETPRRYGGPPRRLRYGSWGKVIGFATVPLCVVFWLVNGWNSAIRAPLITLPVMFALLALEARARNKVDEAELGVFVLSLRQFSDDLKLTIKAKPEETRWAQPANRDRVNLEQFVADEVEKRVGRLVGLGSPRDKVPGGGAGRLYTEDAEWKKVVEALAIASRAIIMQVGDSGPLGDELKIVKDNDLATKLFILTAPAGRTSTTTLKLWRWFGKLTGWSDPRWPDFAALLHDNDYTDATEDPGPGAVITFDANRKRIDVRHDCRTPAEYAQAIADSLAPPP